MNIRQLRTGGPEVQCGSLIFLVLLTRILGLALNQDAVLPCPEKTLDVMVTKKESEMSMSGHSVNLRSDRKPAVWAATLDGTLILSCKGCSQFAHSSFLYWLGNRSFIEHLPGKLWEDKTRRQQQNGVIWLQKDLVLEELSPRLQNTNFSCVLVDPAQVTQRFVLLAQLWQTDTTSLTPNLSHQPRSPSPDRSLTTLSPGEESQPATPTSDQA